MVEERSWSSSIQTEVTPPFEACYSHQASALTQDWAQGPSPTTSMRGSIIPTMLASGLLLLAGAGLTFRVYTGMNRNRRCGDSSALISPRDTADVEDLE